mmetsp:Transcript_32786/g.80449  ORF Transcript_32786/g.80449 Transcript_32786/m.80449 type:complete len:273 (-) Transcript_32786:115-933(-)
MVLYDEGAVPLPAGRAQDADARDVGEEGGLDAGPPHPQVRHLARVEVHVGKVPAHLVGAPDRQVVHVGARRRRDDGVQRHDVLERVLERVVEPQRRRDVGAQVDVHCRRRVRDHLIVGTHLPMRDGVVGRELRDAADGGDAARRKEAHSAHDPVFPVVPIPVVAPRRYDGGGGEGVDDVVDERAVLLVARVELALHVHGDHVLLQSRGQQHPVLALVHHGPRVLHPAELVRELPGRVVVHHDVGSLHRARLSDPEPHPARGLDRAEGQCIPV